VTGVVEFDRKFPSLASSIAMLAVRRTPWMTYSHEQALSAAKVIAVLGARAFRQVSWRRGTKGPYARTSLPFAFALAIVPSSETASTYSAAKPG